MSIVTERRPLVNETIDQACPSTCQRRYEQLRRVLGIVDLLAPAIRYQTTQEVQHAYNERHGTTWHWRTVQRDLEFLQEAGLVEQELRQEFGDNRTATRFWKLNMTRSENAQEAAIAVLDGDCDSEHELFPGAATVATSDPGKGKRLWTVHMAHTQTGQVIELWTGLTKREVFRRLKLWDERKTKSVLIPVPEWLPMPSITFDDVDSSEELEAYLPSGERDSFNVLILVCDTGDCWQVWQGLTFGEVTSRLELWRYNVTNCVLIPWHSDLPVPEGIVNCDPSERLASESDPITTVEVF